MTVAAVAPVLRAAAAQLGGEAPRLEAELLLATALGVSRTWLYAHADDPVGPPAMARFDALLARRLAGEPMAQVTGRREFWSLELAVTADTLIPRPETECLVELALARMPASAPCRVLDLGTGTGAIALALACERPQADLVAVDASAAALAVARGNGARLAPSRLRLLESDWFSALSGERFDLIVSNPPYLAADDPHLRQGDLRFEPVGALVAGADGLAAIRRIVADAPGHLRPGGWLLVEHGWQQGGAVRAIFAAAQFTDVSTALDAEHRERVTLGRA